MDAEGLGRKLLLAPSGDRRRAPEKQTVGTVISHKRLTLQALSSSLNVGQGKKPINKKTHKQNFHGTVPGLSWDCPRLSRPFPKISWEFCL